MLQSVVPGPPFAFGAILVIMALLVAVFMPENPHGTIHVGKSKVRRRNSLTLQAFGLDNGKNKKMFDCEFNTFITPQQTKFWSVFWTTYLFVYCLYVYMVLSTAAVQNNWVRFVYSLFIKQFADVHVHLQL